MYCIRLILHLHVVALLLLSIASFVLICKSLWIDLEKRLLKPGIHYVIFALISPRFYSLIKLTLVEESQSQSADYSWQIPQKYGHRP